MRRRRRRRMRRPPRSQRAVPPPATARRATANGRPGSIRMQRITRVIAAGAHGRAAIDSVILDPARRRAPRGVVAGVGGTQYELALGDDVTLRMGDLLVRDDGEMVEVVAEAEPLIEARAHDLTALARLAWHLGDRHVPIQVLSNRVRMRRDPAIEALLVRLGAKIVAI